MARSRATATVWCSHCNDDAPSAWDDGYISCLRCGKIIDQVLQDIYCAHGQSRVSSRVLHRVQSGYSVSRRRTLERGLLGHKNGAVSETALRLASMKRDRMWERQQRCAEDSNPVQTPAEATSRVPKRKSAASGTNDQKIVSNAGDSDIADGQRNGIEDNESAANSGSMLDADEPTTYKDAEYAGEDYIDYYGNSDEGYSYSEESDFEY